MLTVIICWQLSYAESYHMLTVIICWKLSYADSYHMLTVIICWKLSYADSYHMLTVIIYRQFHLLILSPAAALWTWFRLSLWQKWVPGIFSRGGGKGGRCLGLTNLPPSCAECLEICEPKPPGTLASDRNEYQEYFLEGKGGRCLGLTTLPPSCAECLEIWEPKPPGTFSSCPDLYTDCFTCNIMSMNSKQ